MLANRALEYLAPGLQSTSQVTAELTRDAAEFDGLIVNGAQAHAGAGVAAASSSRS